MISIIALLYVVLFYVWHIFSVVPRVYNIIFIYMYRVCTGALNDCFDPSLVIDGRAPLESGGELLMSHQQLTHYSRTRPFQTVVLTAFNCQGITLQMT